MSDDSSLTKSAQHTPERALEKVAKIDFFTLSAYYASPFEGTVPPHFPVAEMAAVERKSRSAPLGIHTVSNPY